MEIQQLNKSRFWSSSRNFNQSQATLIDTSFCRSQRVIVPSFHYSQVTWKKQSFTSKDFPRSGDHSTPYYYWYKNLAWLPGWQASRKETESTIVAAISYSGRYQGRCRGGNSKSAIETYLLLYELRKGHRTRKRGRQPLMHLEFQCRPSLTYQRLHKLMTGPIPPNREILLRLHFPKPLKISNMWCHHRLSGLVVH